MPRNTVRLDANLTALLNVPRGLERAYYTAGKRSIKRTASWARTHVIRAVAQAAGVKQSALRKTKRVQLHILHEGTAAFLWLGLSDAGASYFGKPRQLKRGAKVRGRFESGAFVASMPNRSTLGIWRRKGDNRIESRPRSVNLWGRTSLPITQVKFPFKGARAAALALQPQISEHLRTAFSSELNYQLNVKGKART